MIDTAYTQAGRLEPGLVKKITLDFLKWIIEVGELAAIRSAVDEIIRLEGTEFQWFLKTGCGCCRDCCDRGYRVVPHEVATGREGGSCRDCSDDYGVGGDDAGGAVRVPYYLCLGIAPVLYPQKKKSVSKPHLT